jgi:hypothetical protein
MFITYINIKCVSNGLELRNHLYALALIISIDIMDEKQFVTVTAYETELVKIINVPAHYSLNEIREAVWAEMNEHADRDRSSIVIAPSEFLRGYLIHRS